VVADLKPRRLGGATVSVADTSSGDGSASGDGRIRYLVVSYWSRTRGGRIADESEVVLFHSYCDVVLFHS